MRELIALDPDFYDPYLMLRDVLNKTGREEEGAALLTEASRRALGRITNANDEWPKALEWGWLRTDISFVPCSIRRWQTGQQAAPMLRSTCCVNFCAPTLTITSGREIISWQYAQAKRSRVERRFMS